MDAKTSDDECVNFAASLFKAKSLADIQTVRQKLCKDAEKHREELRLVVGEKYHELIEAADTFEMMKESSFKVFSGLENCRKLSLKIISDSANSIQITNSTRRTYDDNLKMAVSTVMWLVEVIPQIWRSIEAQELPIAVKKYKQCCEGIEGSFFQSIRSEKVKTFASKLRLTLDCVPSVLITFAVDSLNECSLKKQVATESVFVLLVLKENSLRKLFEDFLSLRLKGFQKLSAQTVTFSVFKNILSEWEKYVMTTLDCARKIFGNNDPASIFEHLRQIGESSLDTKMDKYTPDAIQNYSLPLNIAADLSPEEVEERIDSWECEAKSSVADVLGNFFKNVTSIKSCAKLRILAFQKLSIKGKRCQFWQDYLFTVVQNCIENLVAKSISEMLNACFSSFEQNLDDKNDFNDWLWQESAETAYQVAMLSHTNDLALKSRGIPTSVRNVYQSMDETLGNLLNDASYYIKQLEENDAELNKVKEIISNAAFTLIGELLKKSASIRSLSYGKFLFSVAELNGNIQQALFCGTHDFTELKIELYKSHEAQLNVWIDLVSSDFKKNLKDRLLGLIKDGSSSIGLRWNTIELDDVSARIPCGLCIPLLESLLNLEEKLSKAGGHTLGRAAVHKITSQTGDSVTTAYAECISDANLSQNLALQFYFDIQFVVTLLLGREDKELQARAADVFKQLEHWIDPIDLEILSPHWQSQVSIAVNSMKLLYHCLTPFEKAGIQEFKIASGHYSRIATCTTRPAFKPLTLIPKPGKAMSIVPDKMKTAEEQMVSASKAKMEQSPVSLSNRSFLGAMSSSWFGK